MKCYKNGSNNPDCMAKQQPRVLIELDREEAYEILMRCLESEQADTPLFRSAMQKLARAIESRARSNNDAA